MEKLEQHGHRGWDETRAGEVLYALSWDNEKAWNAAVLLSLPDPAPSGPAEDRKLAECFRKMHRTGQL